MRTLKKIPVASKVPALAGALRTRKGRQNRELPQALIHSPFAVIESSPDGIAVANEYKKIIFFNQRYLDLWGFERHHLLKMGFTERIEWQMAHLAHPDADALEFEVLVLEGGLYQPTVFEMKHGRWFERQIYEYIVAGQKSGLVIHWRDVTNEQEAQRIATYERELMHALMDSVPNQIFFKDTQSRFIRINPSLAKRYGINDPAQAIGKSDVDFYSAEHAAHTAAIEQEIMRTGIPVINQLDHEVWANDVETWNVVSKMPLRDSKGGMIGTYGIAHDISAHKRAEALIWQQANFDTLTGLPNRRLLRDRWAQALKINQRSSLLLGLLMIDLDHFKEVNDTLGHVRGDELLVEAARRIRHCLRSSDTVARLGGDEFAVVLSDLSDAAHADNIAQKIVASMAQPFALGGEQVYVSASIGITLCPQDGDELDELFKQADLAMYVAKAQGRNGLSFFTPVLQAQSQARLRMVTDLRQALARSQCFLVYQPIIDLRTGLIEKAEALLRWQHPQRGLILPSEFISLAESTGLILELGEWVFHQAAKQVCIWRQTLSPRMQIAVNKSPLQFQNQAASPQHWHEHLRSLGIAADAIVIEITEGLLLDTSAQVQKQLQSIRATGIQVSLDDFGTGYSSLSYLQRYDIDFIKIDQSFVHGLTVDSKNMALCSAIVRMAHELGMKVVAEGVETALQRDHLSAMGCDYAQGYFFSPPLTAAALEKHLQSLS